MVPKEFSNEQRSGVAGKLSQTLAYLTASTCALRGHISTALFHIQFYRSARSMLEKIDPLSHEIL